MADAHDLTRQQLRGICPPKIRAKTSNRQMWTRTRRYCLNDCDKCDNLIMLKKIYWELRKLNHRRET